MPNATRALPDAAPDLAVDVVALDSDPPLARRARPWAEARADRALLVLADGTPALRRYARRWVAVAPDARTVLGVAARFDGFASPVVTLAADDDGTADALLAAAREFGPAIVAASASQRLPPALERRPQSVDAWMIAPADGPAHAPTDAPGNPRRDRAVERVSDPRELAAFYATQRMAFWSPAMLRAGPAFGVRDARGTLVAAGGVNFVLPRLRYAQLGALATDARHRGRGHAGRVLGALRAALARAGVVRCGLFAETATPGLAAYYARRGFAAHGHFRFIDWAP